MKIAKVQQIPNLVKSVAIAAPLLFATSTMKAQSFEKKADVFEKSKQTCVVNKPKSVLQVEPIVIGEDEKDPVFVITDLLIHLSQEQLEQKAAKVKKYEGIGLFIFVALPLPGTGAISGAIAAAILDLRISYALPIILLGSIVATSITTGALGIITSLFSLI